MSMPPTSNQHDVWPNTCKHAELLVAALCHVNLLVFGEVAQGKCEAPITHTQSPICENSIMVSGFHGFIVSVCDCCIVSVGLQQPHMHQEVVVLFPRWCG